MLTSCRQLTRKLKIFSIFLGLKEIVSLFLSKGWCVAVTSVCSFVVTQMCRRERGPPLVFRIFLENQRQENFWRKYECWRWCEFGFIFFRSLAKLQRLQYTHPRRVSGKKYNSARLKVRKTFFKKRKKIICNYSATLSIWDENAAVVDKDNRWWVRNKWKMKSSRLSCFDFHKAWKAILIFRFVMQRQTRCEQSFAFSARQSANVKNKQLEEM